MGSWLHTIAHWMLVGVLLAGLSDLAPLVRLAAAGDAGCCANTCCCAPDIVPVDTGCGMQPLGCPCGPERGPAPTPGPHLTRQLADDGVELPDFHPPWSAVLGNEGPSGTAAEREAPEKIPIAG